MSTTQTEVMNPILYRALVREFGAVRVSRAGEPFEARRGTDSVSGWPRLDIVRYGEAYRCCCPFCGDQGFNLNVNHRYGTADERVRWPLDFLATCFAAGCLKDRVNRAALHRRLDRGRGALVKAPIASGAEAPRATDQLPATFTRLDRLRDTHPVRDQLVKCGFDPDRFGRVFGIGYCGKFGTEALARGRVIAPVTQHGDLVGWFAVRFNEDGTTFKTSPGMRAPEVVYNLDRAQEFPAAVVVPSPEWVWRLGGPAVAPLTPTASEQFARTVRCAFRHKQVVLVTPPDCEEDGPLAERLSTALGPNVATVRLPRSAREAGRKELRRLVRAGAAGRGLTVKFCTPDD